MAALAQDYSPGSWLVATLCSCCLGQYLSLCLSCKPSFSSGILDTWLKLPGTFLTSYKSSQQGLPLIFQTSVQIAFLESFPSPFTQGSDLPSSHHLPLSEMTVCVHLNLPCLYSPPASTLQHRKHGISSLLDL